jgi:cell division protein FtsL
MTRLNILLLLVLLGSAVALVRVAYDSRRVYALLDKARNEEHALELEFKRLDAERQAQATHGKVDRVAREKLQMKSATPAITQYVDLPAGSTAVAGGRAASPLPPAGPQGASR